MSCDACFHAYSFSYRTYSVHTQPFDRIIAGYITTCRPYCCKTARKYCRETVVTINVFMVALYTESGYYLNVASMVTHQASGYLPNHLGQVN